jgi:hypothetical protein
MSLEKFKSRVKNFVRRKLELTYNKSYSQEGEDMLLNRLFINKYNGFYIDVGAHHPKRFSNTYFFYKKGWNGINIDAMTGSMLLFDKYRPRDINIEKPISDKKEILDFYIFNEPALNTFSKELCEKRILNKSYTLIDTLKKETFTLAEILEKYLIKSTSIDFLSVDAEGYDFSVLKSNDFSKFRPKIILVEIIGGTIKKILSSDISKFLAKNEYSFYAKTGNTIFFICNKY